MFTRHVLPCLLVATGCSSTGERPGGVTGFETVGSGSPPSGTTEVGEETGRGDTAESSSTTTSSEADESTASTGDTTPPTVVSVSPEDGTRGVAIDTPIVITFSASMSRASAQAAWESPNIGAATMAWSEDDTVLTITPLELAYATGEQANEYSFTIEATALDQAGNALDEALVSTFATARAIEMELPPIDALTGMTYAGGSININDVYVGDTQYDSQQKGVLSFVLPPLPRDTIEITAAILHAQQTIVGGSPYGLLPSLGEIHTLHVDFPTNWDAWEAVAIADVGNFSENAALQTKSIDVTDAVRADYEAAREDTQYRLEFPIATNGNAVLDRCTFTKETVGLTLRYLVE